MICLPKGQITLSPTQKANARTLLQSSQLQSKPSKAKLYKRLLPHSSKNLYFYYWTLEFWSSLMSAMEEVFIGGGASISDGRKSLSLWEVAQKVEQPSQRREASSSDPIINPRTTHEVVTLRRFNELFKKLAKSSSSWVQHRDRANTSVGLVQPWPSS